MALNRKHYTRKRKPIEYIYKDSIPITNVGKIGETNIIVPFDFIRGYKLWEKVKPLEIFSNLLKGQPEENAVKLAPKSSFKHIFII